MALQVEQANHKIKIKIMKLLFIVIFLISITTVNAQDKSNDTTARYFIIQASIGNLQEAAMGKLAVKQAVDTAVRAFAVQMVTDHTNSETQLMQVIRTTGIQVPPEATETPVENLMLKNTHGKDFDRDYVHMMVPDHRQTVQLFEKYALTGKNPVVKEFAQQALPILKEHFASIKVIDDSMNNTAGK